MYACSTQQVIRDGWKIHNQIHGDSKLLNLLYTILQPTLSTITQCTLKTTLKQPYIGKELLQ